MEDKELVKAILEVLEIEAKWGLATAEFNQTAVLNNNDLNKLPAFYKARSEGIIGTEFSLNTEVAKDLIFVLLNFKIWTEEIGETAVTFFSEQSSEWRGKSQLTILPGPDESNGNKFKKWFFCFVHDLLTEKDSLQTPQSRTLGRKWSRLGTVEIACILAKPMAIDDLQGPNQYTDFLYILIKQSPKLVVGVFNTTTLLSNSLWGFEQVFRVFHSSMTRYPGYHAEMILTIPYLPKQPPLISLLLAGQQVPSAGELSSLSLLMNDKYSDFQSLASILLFLRVYRFLTDLDQGVFSPSPTVFANKGIIPNLAEHTTNGKQESPVDLELSNVEDLTEESQISLNGSASFQVIDLSPLVIEDHFIKNFRSKAKIVMNDAILTISKFFCHKYFTMQLISAVDYLEPIFTYQDKLFILNILFYGVLSIKKFGTPSQEDTRLNQYLGRMILTVADGDFHKDCTDQQRLEILTVYCSVLTHKDYIGNCFGGIIDADAIFIHNPFTIDVSLLEDSQVGDYLAVIPLMKRLVDCFDPGSLCLKVALDEVVKLFFVNIQMEEFSKVPFLEGLLQSLIIYLISYYMVAIEDSMASYYDNRYMTILELLELLLTRGVFRTVLLEKFTESGFLTIHNSNGYSLSRKKLFLELVGLFNRLISAKIKFDGVTSQEIDSFLIVNGIVEFVWKTLIKTLPRCNLIFSACASFFREVALQNHGDIIMFVVDQHREEIASMPEVEKYFITYELKHMSLLFRSNYLRDHEQEVGSNDLEDQC